MTNYVTRSRMGLQGLCLAAIFAGFANAADPTAKEALGLRPVQRDIEFETPAKEQLEKCAIQKLSVEGQIGWIVRDATGQILRRFVDTNKDGKLDQWCYYRNGVEVYRDIDADFNGKADQYRWLGTGGIRWGVDENEDGRIDTWKTISPEEVTAEVVASVREKDGQRFSRLLMTSDELKSLGLDETRRSDIAKKIEAATTGFPSLTDRQKIITGKTEWTNFGATQPGVLAAGTDGTTKDVILYENVAAMIDNGGKPAQVAIGTLVQVGSNWRLIDVPGIDNQQTASTHFFTPAPIPAENPVPPVMQKLVARLEALDAKLSNPTSTDAKKNGALHAEKATLIEQLYDASTNPEDRQNWIRQFTESIGAAAQSGDFPEGADRLKTLSEKLEKEKVNRDLLAYVKFGFIRTSYMLDVQDSKANVAKIQDNWVEKLEAFVTEFPNSSDTTSEALFQLAIAKEFTGDAAAAIKRYAEVVDRFPTSEVAEKSAGARRRLESVGQPLVLKGRTLDGKAFDLSAYKGYVVLVHYWASWCEPCKQDFETLKNLQTKHAKKFAVIGVNLDNDAKLAQGSLQAMKQVTWPQIFDPGTPEKRGLEGRLANELGIFTLPTMLLIDANGKVINRNIHAAELDSELGKLLGVSAGIARKPMPATPAVKGRP